MWRLTTEKEDGTAADTDAPHTTARCHSSGYIYTLRGVGGPLGGGGWLLTMMPVVKTGPGRLPFGLFMSGNVSCQCAVGPDLQDSSRSRTDGTRSNRYLLRCCQRCGAAPGGRCQSDLGYNVAWSSPWSWCVPSSHTKKDTHNIASETPQSQSHTTTAGCDEGNTAYGGFAQQHAWFLPAPPPPPET